MISIREATERDAAGIREIFLITYSRDYPYVDFYNERSLKRLIYSDETIMLVAVDDDGRIVGTGSVMLDFGAYTDLVGEFGRLAVHPDVRSQGVASQIMQRRIELVKDRLHLGMIEARTAHDYSQRNAEAHGFACVGFLPLKLEFAQRESACLMARHFGPALELRRNNPRIIPEAHPFAARSLTNLSIAVDPVVDDRSPPYPEGGDYRLDHLTTRGYASLLRMERGRVERREIFGSMRLHYGFFRIQASRSTYLLARDKDHVAGAIGFTVDPIEHSIKVFELVHRTDEVVRFLVSMLLETASGKLNTAYIEIDVNADAPRMQRTLLELGFVPVAYVPAMTFCDVERLDVVRMIRLTADPAAERPVLTPGADAIRALVLETVAERRALPELAGLLRKARLFDGLTDEQAHRVAAICTRVNFATGELIYCEGDPAGEMLVLLEGRAQVQMGLPSRTLGKLRAGDTIGDVSLLLSGKTHSATVVATTEIDALSVAQKPLEALLRRRPDIGSTLLRNLAIGLSEKLRGSDRALFRLT